MKCWILRREFSCENETPIFEATGFTKTHGTDISASIALDALIELTHPVIQPLVLFHPLDLLQPLALGDSLGLLSYHPFGWIGLVALTGLRQLRRTRNPYRNDPIFIELIPLEELN
jgi:hypothetical protein